MIKDEIVMNNRELVKDFYGKVIGSIETVGTKQIARDFYGKVLGRYDSTDNKTRDFYGKVLTQGNTLMGLLFKK
jgi:extradiol dioxygenase family protein